jgi:hypothetical protein
MSAEQQETHRKVRKLESCLMMNPLREGWRGDVEMVKILLANGAPPNEIDLFDEVDSPPNQSYVV